MQEFLLSILTDYTLRNVTLGALTVGIFAGALGSFAVLRKQSLLGDAMSHAALPGIALAFIITVMFAPTLSKHPLTLLVGALIAGWIGTLFMIGVTRTTFIKKDAALGIVLSVFFGFGLVLLTYISRLPTARKAGLDKFLFGNASTLMHTDVQIMLIMGFICLTLLIIFWKEFKLLSFDPLFGASLGFSMPLLDVMLTSLIVIAIVIGLQTVGVVLMSAMIIAPAAAARQWTNKLSTMVLLSSIFGAVAGVAGALTSALISKLPTGPTIVVYITVIVIISLVFAPNRGLLWEWIYHLKHKQDINIMRVALTIFHLAETHNDPFRPHHISSLQAINNPTSVRRTLKQMKNINWVQEVNKDHFHLTAHGFEETKRLHKEYEGGSS